MSYKIWVEAKIGSADVATATKLEISMAGDMWLMVAHVFWPPLSKKLADEVVVYAKPHHLYAKLCAHKHVPISENASGVMSTKSVGVMAVGVVDRQP